MDPGERRSDRRPSPLRVPLRTLMLMIPVFLPASVFAQSPDEFFEREIRPILAGRCQECHGEAKPKAGLRLTSRSSLLLGGEGGPAAVPGEPEESLIVRAVRYRDEPRMPPKKKLSDREVEAISRWVALGLPWPEARAPGPVEAGKAGAPYRITDDQRRFWSFQPVREPSPPAVKDGSWPRSDLDRFILAGLEAKGLRPAEPADRRTLLRRATFDLTGLPPTPEEVDAFLADESPDAFAKVVDRLLASPRYGERWGRHWLDLARYADWRDARGSGDTDFRDVWRYRDWVVSAFNRDLPYDRFVRDQVAGDLLPSDTPGAFNADGLVATGLLAIGEWGAGDADKEKMMTDIVDDQIDVVGRAVLGLTLACARCHDHKFDPIPQADYYALAGIFFSTHILPGPGPKTNGSPLLHTPILPRDQVADLERRRADYPMTVAELDSIVRAAEESADRDVLDSLRSERDALKAAPPPPVPTALAAQEGGVPNSPHAGIHDARIHIRGSYARLGEPVPRGFPRILAGEGQPPIPSGSGRRELARWLTRPDHPLTARVMVNRIWQHHFGSGIVRTPSNFGKLGEPPSDPGLLDHLASRFVASGWSIKAMHRAILLSATYRQSSRPPVDSLRLDPENRLFGRMNRRRLESEAIRDTLLAVAGHLDPAPASGGPATGDFSAPRRTLYLRTVRSDRSSFGPLFDAADATAIVEARTVSTVAPQSLFLLNNPFVLEQARRLVKRLADEAPSDDESRIRRAYAILYARPPEPDEVALGLAALSKLRASGPEARAWSAYCQILLCSNELIYID